MVKNNSLPFLITIMPPNKLTIVTIIIIIVSYFYLLFCYKESVINCLNSFFTQWLKVIRVMPQHAWVFLNSLLCLVFSSSQGHGEMLLAWHALSRCTSPASYIDQEQIIACMACCAQTNCTCLVF